MSSALVSLLAFLNLHSPAYDLRSFKDEILIALDDLILKFECPVMRPQIDGKHHEIEHKQNGVIVHSFLSFFTFAV